MTSARQRLWPVPIDGLVAALAVAAAVLAVVFDGDTTAEWEPVDLAAAALGGTALLVRHRRPAVTLGVIVAARAVLTIGGVDRFGADPLELAEEDRQRRVGDVGPHLRRGLERPRDRAP